MRNKSFTLIEILVVIVVVGILSAFILVGMSSITGSAKIAKANAFLDSMDSSLLLGRVSQWKLDETSGTSANDSWLSNIGTLINFADTSAGYGDTHGSGWMSSNNCISGTCLKFDGVDDYIDCGTGSISSLTDKKMTISIWVKVYNVDSWQHLVHTGWAANGAYLLALYNSGATLQMKNSVGTSYSATYADIISINNWYNVVGLYNDSDKSLKVYVNGIKAATDGTATGTMLTVSGTTFIATSELNGLIDDIRIYNQAMSNSEIENNYYTGINSLFKNNQIGLKEFNKRLIELKNNLANK
ncbi:LamG domain-containing protein [Candidatus Parcubacteria bacterium]|nr:LamG domain-containing protein [Candidatus Parcubacteria bacterium]